MQEEEFVLIEPDTEGIIRSNTFPGLWLAVSALLAGNMIEVLSVLQLGITRDEHQVFVRELAGRSRPSAP